MNLRLQQIFALASAGVSNNYLPVGGLVAIRPLPSSPRADSPYPRYLRVFRPAASPGDRSWLDRYSSRLRATELIIVTISVACATVARYGGPAAEYGAPRLLNPVGDINLSLIHI